RMGAVDEQNIAVTKPMVEELEIELLRRARNYLCRQGERGQEVWRERLHAHDPAASVTDRGHVCDHRRPPAADFDNSIRLDTADHAVIRHGVAIGVLPTAP